MKITLPEALKAEVPTNAWGKVLAATPVVLTVIATMLAGLSSGEMTRGQYERSLATQEQSKAGDQWGLFQAKRLRGAMQGDTLLVLKGSGAVHPLDVATTLAMLGQFGTQPEARNALDVLISGRLPAPADGSKPDQAILALLHRLDENPSDLELEVDLAAVSDRAIANEIRAAQGRARSQDAATAPVTSALARIEQALDTLSPANPSLARDFSAAELAFSARRYETEAHLNQFLATLYELQVRKSNVAADRHVRRSQRFFSGMLAAQCGVIIATFAVAARNKSLLWALAAAAGAGAVTLAIWVYVAF